MGAVGGWGWGAVKVLCTFNHGKVYSSTQGSPVLSLGISAARCIIDDLFRRCTLSVVNVCNGGCDLKCIEESFVSFSLFFFLRLFPFPPPTVNTACINT